VQIDLTDDLPLVLADPVLLERSIANLVANALRHSPPDAIVRVDAGAVDGHLHVRIIDRGPGIPVADRERGARSNACVTRPRWQRRPRHGHRQRFHHRHARRTD
jgi:signal transduction histidine kinase